MKVRNRPYGVEIECGIPHNTVRQEAEADKVVAQMRALGWHRGWDGSGFEFSSSILTGRTGHKKIRQACDIILSAGGYVTQSDGLHVHHDRRDLSTEQLYAFAKAWSDNLREIHKLVPAWRRHSGMCKPLSSSELNSIKTHGAAARHNSRALTVYIPSRHGTIEIRQHHGTLDADEIISWVEFGQKFIAACKRRSKVSIPRCDLDPLLNTIKVSNQNKAYLMEKAARLAA